MFKISAAIYCPGLLSDLKQLTIMALEGKKKTHKKPHIYLSYFGCGVCMLYLFK